MKEQIEENGMYFSIHDVFTNFLLLTTSSREPTGVGGRPPPQAEGSMPGLPQTSTAKTLLVDFLP